MENKRLNVLRGKNKHYSEISAKGKIVSKIRYSLAFAVGFSKGFVEGVIRGIKIGLQK